MNDTKNILLAWVSSISSIVTTVESTTLTSIVTAIVLPITLFALGKTIDVAVQIYLKRHDANELNYEKPNKNRHRRRDRGDLHDRPDLKHVVEPQDRET